MAFGAIVMFLTIPIILLTVTLLLIIGFSVTFLSSLYNQLNEAVGYIFPTREILTYFADKIPPSVGRVEVSQQKQLKDYQDKLNEKENSK